MERAQQANQGNGQGQNGPFPASLLSRPRAGEPHNKPLRRPAYTSSCPCTCIRTRRATANPAGRRATAGPATGEIEKTAAPRSGAWPDVDTQGRGRSVLAATSSRAPESGNRSGNKGPVPSPRRTTRKEIPPGGRNRRGGRNRDSSRGANRSRCPYKEGRRSRRKSLENEQPSRKQANTGQQIWNVSLGFPVSTGEGRSLTMSGRAFAGNNRPLPRILARETQARCGHSRIRSAHFGENYGRGFGYTWPDRSLHRWRNRPEHLR